MIIAADLDAIMPMPAVRLYSFLDVLNAAMDEFSINTPARMAAFLAQAAHESTRLGVLVENLNYSAQGLITTWPRRFSYAESADYARKPERIANRVYANRLGNGDEASGDGWRFRGRGLFQITGRGNYAECSKALYNDELLIEKPELLEQPEGASRSAGWFWQNRGLNNYADSGDFRTLTIRINGGLNGWAERQEYYLKAKQVLGVA